MKKKLIITIIFLIISGFIGLIIWGRVQYPYLSIVPGKTDHISKISIDARETDLEKGIRTIYDASNLHAESVMWKDLQTILEKTYYRKSFENIIPWFPDSKRGLRNINIIMVGKDNTYTINWDENNFVEVMDIEGDNPMYRYYHIVDNKYFEELMSYIKTNIGSRNETMSPGGIAP